MKNKGSGWRNESRRHSLARKGIKTNVDHGRRFDVSKFVARGNNEKSEYYQDGYAEGMFAGDVNLNDDFEEMIQAYKDDELGEIVSQIREVGTQMSGDISYDVMSDEDDEPTSTRWIKPSEYEEWEDGFYAGLYNTVRMAYINHNIKAIYDNGGKTADRYTVIYADGDVVGMGDTPFHPQGFNQYSGNIHDWGLKTFDHLGKKVKLEDMNKDVQKAIEQRIGD